MLSLDNYNDASRLIDGNFDGALLSALQHLLHRHVQSAASHCAWLRSGSILPGWRRLPDLAVLALAVQTPG